MYIPIKSYVCSPAPPLTLLDVIYVCRAVPCCVCAQFTSFQAFAGKVIITASEAYPSVSRYSHTHTIPVSRTSTTLPNAWPCLFPILGGLMIFSENSFSHEQISSHEHEPASSFTQ